VRDDECTAPAANRATKPDGDPGCYCTRNTRDIVVARKAVAYDRGADSERARAEGVRMMRRLFLLAVVVAAFAFGHLLGRWARARGFISWRWLRRRRWL
jgi:hypothetical protein